MKRLVAIAICILILTLSFTACSNNENERSIIVDKDDSPLMIYIWDGDEAMKYHINTYNALHDEVQIEYEAFSGGSLRFMEKKIEKDIKNGNGPDLIKIDSQSIYSTDFANMIEDGLFADMDILIENSKQFDSSLYNQDMLDGAIIDGQRAFIPISYDIEIMISTKQSFENNGLDPLETLTKENFFSTLDAFYQNTLDDKSPFMNTDLSLSVFNYMDQENYITDCPELRKLLDMGKEAYKRDKNSGIEQAYRSENFDYYNWYFDNDILFTRLFGRYDDIYTRFYYKYSLFKYKYDRDLLVYKYPILSEKTKAYPETAFAISATSNKKNKAFKFIEYMLSSDVQSDKDFAPTIPVNKECYQLVKDKFISGNYDFASEVEFSSVKAPDELCYRFIDLVEGADYAYDNSLYLYYHCRFKYYLDMYVRGGKPYDTLIDDINEDLEKYYNDIEDYHF